MKHIVWLAVLGVGALGCSGAKETGHTGSPFFDVCNYLSEHAGDYGEEAAFEVYCQSTVACEESTRVAVTQSLLIDAQAACEEADELNNWEYLEGECPQQAGEALGAVRCWSLD